MKDIERITQIKQQSDRNAYRRGFEEGGFAGAFGITGVFLFIVYFVVPYIN